MRDDEPPWHERTSTVVGASAAALVAIGFLWLLVSYFSDGDPTPTPQYFLDPGVSSSTTTTTSTITRTSPPVTTDIDPGDTTTSSTDTSTSESTTTTTTTSTTTTTTTTTTTPTTTTTYGETSSRRPRYNETRTVYPPP